MSKHNKDLRRSERGAGYRRMRERGGEDYERMLEDTLRLQREALERVAKKTADKYIPRPKGSDK